MSANTMKYKEAHVFLKQFNYVRKSLIVQEWQVRLIILFNHKSSITIPHSYI